MSDPVIKVVSALGSKEKTASTIEILAPMSREAKSKLKSDIGDLVVESILKSVSSQESPVDGESWPALTSKAYKKEKQAEVGNQEANMELTGAMLDSLDFKTTKSGVEVGIFGKQAWKADGHNKFSGAENGTPQRRFLPGEGQEFVAGIQNKIEDLVRAAVVESATSDIRSQDLNGITTRSALYDFLSSLWETDSFELSRQDIKDAVLGNPDLVEVLDQAGVLEYL